MRSNICCKKFFFLVVWSHIVSLKESPKRNNVVMLRSICRRCKIKLLLLSGPKKPGVGKKKKWPINSNQRSWSHHSNDLQDSYPYIIRFPKEIRVSGETKVGYFLWLMGFWILFYKLYIFSSQHDSWGCVGYVGLEGASGFSRCSAGGFIMNQELVQSAFRARICKRLRSPGIDSANLCCLTARCVK